jgi:hypothetical protein
VAKQENGYEEQDMPKQRTTLDHSGSPMHLWIQYEDGLHEPVRKDGDLNKKSRAHGNADWWVVPKAPRWKPEDDGFRTTDNHPGPPQDTTRIRPRNERPDPAEVMADIAAGADGSLTGKSMHADVATGNNRSSHSSPSGKTGTHPARRRSRETGQMLGSALKTRLEAFADGYVNAPDVKQILIQGGLSRSRPEAARHSSWGGLSGGNIAAHMYDALHEESGERSVGAARRKRKP